MPFGKAIVRGISMAPTLGDRDELIVRYGSGYDASDIIVFIREGQHDIKRVESVTTEGVFVLGDNEIASLDSRNYGRINPQDIIGKAIFRIKPRFGRIEKRRI
jgi:phage repressor protein C with HTH and peptisase S24 domain